MADHDRVMAALDGGKKKKTPTHTHGVHYERAGNGGFIAHVHKHHGKGPHSEGHSHTEEHIVPDMASAQAHLEEQMGDHPAVDEMAGGEPPEGGAAEEGQEQPQMAE